MTIQVAIRNTLIKNYDHIRRLVSVMVFNLIFIRFNIFELIIYEVYIYN
jgi:hypothetical protein